MNEIFTFYIIYTVFWIFWASSIIWIPKFEVKPNTFGLIPILILAIGIRLLIFYIDPIFDDDWARFIWDGKIFALEGNPYSTRPIDWFGKELDDRESVILSSINHPEYSTIYFPFFQFVFLVAYSIAGNEIWGLRIIYLFFDLGILYYLLRFSHSKINTKIIQKYTIFLWGFSPLWILEFYFNLHPDIIGIFLLLAGFYYWTQNKDYLAGVFWGFSLATKPVFVVLLFLILIWNFRNYLQNFSLFHRQCYIGFFSVIVFILTWIPFIGDNSELTSISNFLLNFEFNSSVFALINILFPDYAYYLSGLFYLVFLILNRYLCNKEEEYLFISIGIGSLFLFSSVANPWYLLWSFPFLYISLAEELIEIDKISSLRLNYWIIFWSLTIVISYSTGQNLGLPEYGVYDHPLWVRPIQFIPVYVLMGLTILKQLKSKFAKHIP